MQRFIRMAVVAGGASLLAAGPVFAQDLNALNPLQGLGIDLDPFHILTPAPAPAPPPAAPAPRGHRHHHFAHRVAHRHHHAGAHHKSHHVAKAPKTAPAKS